MGQILQLVVLFALVVGLDADSVLNVQGERVDVVVDNQHVLYRDVREGGEVFDVVIYRKNPAGQSLLLIVVQWSL